MIPNGTYVFDRTHWRGNIAALHYRRISQTRGWGKQAMIIDDSSELQGIEDLEADICILGAGPAGLTLARELEGVGRRIILIESGGLEFDEATQSLCAGPGDDTPDPYRLRCRQFGGASNWWGGSSETVGWALVMLSWMIRISSRRRRCPTPVGPSVRAISSLTTSEPRASSGSLLTTSHAGKIAMRPAGWISAGIGSRPQSFSSVLATCSSRIAVSGSHPQIMFTLT